MKKDDYEYVYMIYDQRNPDDILYVGKTNSIESRYCDHFHGSKSKKKLWITPENREFMIMREVEETEKENIFVREMFWIQELNPKYNVIRSFQQQAEIIQNKLFKLLLIFIK